MAIPRKRSFSPDENATEIIPALSPEAKNNELIALATAVAEKQLREGTASSQLIVHYLKMGTERERLERVKLEAETKLLAAKTVNVESAQETKQMLEEAIRAMSIYKGSNDGI